MHACVWVCRCELRVCAQACRAVGGCPYVGVLHGRAHVGVSVSIEGSVRACGWVVLTGGTQLPRRLHLYTWYTPLGQGTPTRSGHPPGPGTPAWSSIPVPFLSPGQSLTPRCADSPVTVNICSPRSPGCQPLRANQQAAPAQAPSSTRLRTVCGTLLAATCRSTSQTRHRRDPDSPGRCQRPGVARRHP